MVPRRRWLLAGGIASLACALAVTVLLTFSHGRSAPARSGAASALAVVLAPGADHTDLVVVDLATARVVRTIRLRSLVTDIDADPVSGTVAGAQTGGIGAAADDALSLADPWSGRVRYVRLPDVDPSQVECAGGRALVLHAIVDPDGYRVSSVDLVSANAVAAGHAPDGPGLWAAAGDGVWTAVPSGGPGGYALARLDPVSLATSPAVGVGFAPSGVVPVGDAVAVLGRPAAGEPGEGCVALITAGGASVLTSASVPGLPHGAQMAALVEDALVVGDWNGDLPESGSLVVLDGRTLETRRALRVGGAPCALAAYGDRLLVVDRVAGTLTCIDVVSGTSAWTVSLGSTDLVCSKVLVLPGRTAADPTAATGGV
jgi:hypothetical protein